MDADDICCKEYNNEQPQTPEVTGKRGEQARAKAKIQRVTVEEFPPSSALVRMNANGASWEGQRRSSLSFTMASDSAFLRFASLVSAIHGIYALREGGLLSDIAVVAPVFAPTSAPFGVPLVESEVQVLRWFAFSLALSISNGRNSLGPSLLAPSSNSDFVLFVTCNCPSFYSP